MSDTSEAKTTRGVADEFLNAEFGIGVDDIETLEGGSPNEVAVPAWKLEAGDELWVLRDDVRTLAKYAYYFQVHDYDNEHARVTIEGHADDEDADR